MKVTEGVWVNVVLVFDRSEGSICCVGEYRPSY